MFVVGLTAISSGSMPILISGAVPLVMIMVEQLSDMVLLS